MDGLGDVLFWSGKLGWAWAAVLCDANTVVVGERGRGMNE